MGQNVLYLLKEKPKPQKTLAVIVKDGKILLGMKKRGFGAGKYNGFGGGVESGETLQEATIRELNEECGLNCDASDIKKVGEFDFYFPHKLEFNQTVHAYLIGTFTGEPKETEEMAFCWFNLDEIPYLNMWDDDKYWLPLILRGKKLRAKFVFKQENGENIVSYKHIKTIPSFN